MRTYFGQRVGYCCIRGYLGRYRIKDKLFYLTKSTIHRCVQKRILYGATGKIINRKVPNSRGNLEIYKNEIYASSHLLCCQFFFSFFLNCRKCRTIPQTQYVPWRNKNKSSSFRIRCKQAGGFLLIEKCFPQKKKLAKLIGN